MTEDEGVGGVWKGVLHGIQSTRLFPMELSLGCSDEHIVDAGKVALHPAVCGELPVLVTVGAPTARQPALRFVLAWQLTDGNLFLAAPRFKPF